MNAPTETDLRSLEERVQHALRTLDNNDLQVLGYGEVTTVFRLDTEHDSFACKRFPLFRNRSDAEAHQGLVHRYIAELAARGLNVLETGFVSLYDDDGRTVLYLIQPIVEAERIGPNYFRTLEPEIAQKKFEEILTTIESSVTPELAPDGQLSNWVFLDEGLFYVDVSTPFMRDAEGAEAVNWDVLYESVIGGILTPLRPYFRRQIPSILESYFSVRGQVLDFLGNLRKEKLDPLIPAFLSVANARLDLSPPLTLKDVQAYYNEDADVYALLMRLYRINRAFHRHVLRRPYPNFIPPKIDRNKF
ncbi:MAG: hypothetical protein IID08_02475 [Candidatus Hydrogenedentes bacterium]|nr:hypothetical protein [Candidatus Hydrogenedentota bacterium]